jgi:tight adherence protein C
MPLSVWLSAMAIAVAVPLAWWSMSGTRSTVALRARANLSDGVRRVTDLREVVLQQSAQERVVRPFVAGLARQARRVTPAGMIDKLERRLSLAGLSQRWTVEQALAAKMVTGLAGALFGAVIFLADPSFGRLMLLVILTGTLSFVPDLVLSSRAEERQAEIQRALADALDQITVCVEAGLSFEAAMARIAGAHGPLADEFGRTLQDIQIGIPRAQALENLLARTNVVDLRAFVHAVSHADRYGVPIAQVLRVQSAELRDKRKQRAEERAMKMPVKLVFPVVLCIFPALFVVLVGPAAIRIAENL